MKARSKARLRPSLTRPSAKSTRSTSAKTAPIWMRKWSSRKTISSGKHSRNSVRTSTNKLKRLNTSRSSINPTKTKTLRIKWRNWKANMPKMKNRLNPTKMILQNSKNDMNRSQVLFISRICKMKSTSIKRPLKTQKKTIKRPCKTTTKRAKIWRWMNFQRPVLNTLKSSIRRNRKPKFWRGRTGNTRRI